MPQLHRLEHRESAPHIPPQISNPNACSPELRSLPRTKMSGRTPKYLPLPHPTSATRAPGARLSIKARTRGQMANLWWKLVWWVSRALCTAQLWHQLGTGSLVSDSVTLSAQNRHAPNNSSTSILPHPRLALRRPGRTKVGCNRVVHSVDVLVLEGDRGLVPGRGPCVACGPHPRGGNKTVLVIAVGGKGAPARLAGWPDLGDGVAGMECVGMWATLVLKSLKSFTFAFFNLRGTPHLSKCQGHAAC